MTSLFSQVDETNDYTIRKVHNRFEGMQNLVIFEPGKQDKSKTGRIYELNPYWMNLVYKIYQYISNST